MLRVFIKQRVGRLAPLAACFLACLLVFTTSLAAEPRQLSLRFDAPQLSDGLTLSTFGREPGPRLLFGHLRLLDGHRGQRNAVAFDALDDTAYTRLDVACRFRMRRGPEGWSLLLLDLVRYGDRGPPPRQAATEAPNLPGCFAVGIDAYDPPTKNIFDLHGNVYGRPQREVSLHWNGRELVRRLSPVEFGDRKFHDLHLALHYVTGGALVTLTLDGIAVYSNYFVPQIAPYPCRLALGGRTDGSPTSPPGTAVEIDDLSFRTSEPAGLVRRPVHFHALTAGPFYSAHRFETHEVTFPHLPWPVGRIILTLTLGPGPGGYDPWDRSAAVYVWGDDGERYEIMRYITPYRRGYQWQVDVTDYQSLLRGRRKMAASVGTWQPAAAEPAKQKGWTVRVDLDFYPGQPRWQAFRVRNLWSGSPEYGNPEHPLDEFFSPRRLRISPQTERAKLKITVTGHGQHPATANAAEFFPARRVVSVNGHRFENVLWRTDCWLNPCRPQGGTWKFDRAGWCPGSVVRPWILDITDLVHPGGEALITYVPQPYVNKNRNKARALHWLEVQLIEYRRVH